jgi:hypothetical protein
LYFLAEEDRESEYIKNMQLEEYDVKYDFTKNSGSPDPI